MNKINYYFFSGKVMGYLVSGVMVSENTPDIAMQDLTGRLLADYPTAHNKDLHLEKFEIINYNN